ncbi:MAG: hypothetical protein M1826_006451 [Phylliscum demangeonii]|nr:MAG: hypothetical protein M1826_006451 [Phylliscum demangeonii]
MRFSWHHLALWGAIPAAVVVAVLPPQFTYDALVSHLLDEIAEGRDFFCHHCMNYCIKVAREGSYLHDQWPDRFPRVPENECEEDCNKDLPGSIRNRLRVQVENYRPKALADYVRGLPVDQQEQALAQGTDALKRAADDVGTGIDHRHRKCQHSDGGIPPLNPNSPENRAALKKGGTRDRNDIVPFKRRSGGNPPNRPSSSLHQHQTRPPSARDNWAAEEPYHTPLRIDWICVVSQRVQGFTPAAAEARCRYKPVHKQQRQQQQLPVQPLAIPAIPGTAPGTAPILEPAIPLLAPGLGGAALLLRGGV